MMILILHFQPGSAKQTIDLEEAPVEKLAFPFFLSRGNPRQRRHPHRRAALFQRKTEGRENNMSSRLVYPDWWDIK